MHKHDRVQHNCDVLTDESTEASHPLLIANQLSDRWHPFRQVLPGNPAWLYSGFGVVDTGLKSQL
jgi:hypothetical protein